MSAVALPDLAQAIEAEHQAAVGAARSAIDHAVACGRLLIQAKAQVPHGEWLPWIEANLTFGPRQAQKYARLADRARDVDQMRLENSHLTIDQALAALADHRDNSHMLRVMGSSASDEWYTPPHVVELVEDTLGEVDLDPCWHPESPVRATTTYTAAADGLAQPWAGRVYMNPPYGRGIGAWVEKLVAEYEAGEVSEAIALVPARTDAAWFRRFDPFPRCFVWGRLSFSGVQDSAAFPSAVIYLGRNVRYFAKVFGAIGGIWVRFDGAAP
jgi:hypothetical protein